MKFIKISKDKQVIVDNEDFNWLNQSRWYCHNAQYAARKDKNKHIYMHRLILNAPKGLEVDHINRNGLDNRKENLRIVTHSQNMFNQKTRKDSKSGYRHIHWNKQKNKWQVIMYIGAYSKIEDAILALKNYDFKRS